MSESMLRRILRDHQARRRSIALILCLSMVVSLGVFSGLRKDAVAKTYTRVVLECPYMADDAAQVVHTHNDDCYDEVGNLVCTLPELEAHTHGDECYTEVRTLVCGLEENPGHRHTDDCYTAETTLVCGLEENEGHQHTGDCYTLERGELLCDNTDEEHEHTDDCFAWNEVLSCGMEAGEGAHLHSEDCYRTDWILTCGMEEGEGAHTHTDACYLTDRVLTCDKPEIILHTHTDDCYQKNDDGSIYVDEDGYSWLICGQPEIIEHVHDENCFKVYELDDGEPEETAAGEEIITADETAGEQAEAEGTNETEPTITEAENTDEAEDTEEKTDSKDTAELNENEENKEETKDETKEENESTDTETEVPAVPMPAQSFEKTAGGIRVSVEAPEGAFPENTRMSVKPVNGSGLVDTVSDAVNGEILEVQAVDITFYDANDNEIEPATAIRVSIVPANSQYSEEKANVVHIDSEGAATAVEQAEGTTEDNSEVVFDVDSFSIYAIVYTVHFEYEVDGQVYTSSVPGAQDKLLSELIRELNVVSEEQCAEFMTKIAEVGISNPEVLKITETEGDWTIRPLKDSEEEESLTIVMQDGATFRITVDAEGITEVRTEDETAIIRTVNDLYLPQDATAVAQVLTGEESGSAIAAVQQAAGTDAEEVLENADDAVAAVDAVDTADTGTNYHAFSIGLENVDVEAYDGFNVSVTLPEDAVVGRDFQLFQVQKDGSATEITETLELNSERDEDGLQAVSELSFTTDSFAEYVLSYSIETYYTTYEGDALKISLNYGPKAGIPEGAELKVSEILPEDERYSDYLNDSVTELGVKSGAVSFARFLDIEIQKDGEKIEPQAPVSVKIEMMDLPEETGNAQAQVIHFGEQTEVLAAEATGTDVSFETGSFSVYGVVYTVDFHYEVNGQTFEFSIPGGGFISLEHLIEVLGINVSDAAGIDSVTNEAIEEEYTEYGVETVAEEIEEAATAVEEAGDNVSSNAEVDAAAAYEQAINLNNVPVSEETRAFVAEIATVEFSSPQLVWVGKVDEESTVGALKEANGLEVEYSANLTEEQIEEINAQTVEAGDWALISVQPFTSEESLTVTMKNGEVFTIRVTDAQISTDLLTATGETYTITVKYDNDAEIPDDAKLIVTEILSDSKDYADYLDQAQAVVGNESAETPYADQYARFFDIEIRSGEEKIEPSAPVDVTIQLTDAPKSLDHQLQVVHFETVGPIVMDAKEEDEGEDGTAEMSFVTESFSVYGVIVANPSGASGLDGMIFTISRDGRYLMTNTTDIGNGGDHAVGFTKGQESDNPPVWQFEKNNDNTYNIFTIVNNEKKYMHLGKSSGNNRRANASLSDQPQAFSVQEVNGGYRLSTWDDGTQYYLDEHNGTGGNGFAGWNGQSNNGILSLNFKQPVMQNDSQYMTLVKYNGKYYIVNNDCSLTEVDYNEVTKTVEVDDPMMWSVNRNNPNGHIYFKSRETGFNGLQMACDWYLRYLDPSSEMGYLEETNEQGAGHVDIDNGDWHYAEGAGWYQEHHITNRTDVANNTTVSIDNTSSSDSTLYNIHHGSNYLGVVTNADGSLRLAGQQTSDNAAEFVFASPTKVKGVSWTNHTVDHIDISIAGTANVSVPLAYGKYYGSTAGDAEEPILTVSDNTKVELSEAQMVDPSQLRITAEDMKRATITAARADNGTQIDDAFYIAGYSGNVANGTSNDQVRIEGSFLVADLRGTQYENVNTDQYQNYNTLDANSYTRQVRQARKNNTVEYTVTVVKPLTYHLIDPELGQLYDAEGHPITVTIDVAFSASFNYWDSENECPAVNWATGFGGDAWTSGGIDPSNISGMDFVLGGNADNPNSPLTALEITKVIMDESGNRIELKVPVTNYFDIYEKKNATNEQKNGVAGLHVVDSLNHPEWQADSRDATIRNGYTYWRTKRVTVDETGSSIVFDFDATDAMYYIVEKHDEESLPQIVEDKAGNDYVYVKTYFETEYVRRDDEAGTHDEYSNKSLHPQAMHITEDYTRASTSDYAYASIPEVAGKFYKLNGEQKKEGFLEFYVYNIYRPVHGDINVHKQWQNSEGVADDWLADVIFKLRKKTVTVTGEGDDQTQIVTYSDVAKPEYMGDDWSDTITVTSATGEAKWEELPELGENESYVVIEHDIAGHEGTVISDILRDELSGAITSFKLTKGGKTYTYDVTNGLLGDEGGTTINKQRKETDITLKKVDKDSLNEENPDLLKGASFTVSKYLNESYQGMDTTWGTSGSTTVSDDKNQDGTYTLNGTFVFQGLQEGYYQIEETRFPDGYIKVSGNARFKVEENANHELEISLISNPDNLLLLEDNKLTIVVGNTPGTALPNTGGPGTRLFTILGSILTLGAGVLLWRRRRTI